MIELRTLRQFLAVAEELHFGRAAERLHMTQPPLTQAIQKLETSLGATLFERSSRSVALSAAGLALLPQARALLMQADALPALIQAAARGGRGQLRLGFVSTAGFGELPRWLRLFREAFVDIELSLREATLDVQLREFEQNDLDAGFIIHAPGAQPAGFERLKISSEAMVLALSTEDALAGALSLDTQVVLRRPLVIFPREIAPSLFDALLALYRQHGLAPNIVQQAIQMQTIVNLVSAGIGLAWVPAAVMAFQRAGVIYRPLAEAAPLCETSLIWRRDAAPTVLRFVEHIEQLLVSSVCRSV